MTINQLQVKHCVVEMQGLFYLYVYNAERLWGAGAESAIRLVFSILFVQLAMIAEIKPRRGKEKGR